MLPRVLKTPEMVNTGVAVHRDVLEDLERIVKNEGVKSRNRLIGSFLEFAVQLFPLVKLLEKRIASVEAAEGATRAETIALLVELGLTAWEREHPRARG